MKHTIAIIFGDEKNKTTVKMGTTEFTFADANIDIKREPVEDHTVTSGFRRMKPGPILEITFRGKILSESKIMRQFERGVMSKLTGWNTNMADAPRDGTPICLGWVDDGIVEEYYYPMVWDPEAGNPLVQKDKGLWVCRSHGKIVFTWSEENPDGAPDVWRLYPPWYNMEVN